MTSDFTRPVFKIVRSPATDEVLAARERRIIQLEKLNNMLAREVDRLRKENERLTAQ